MSSIRRILRPLVLALIALPQAATLHAQEAPARPAIAFNGFSLVPPPSGWGSQRTPNGMIFGKIITEAADPRRQAPLQSFVLITTIERTDARHLADAAAMDKFAREELLAPARSRRQSVVSAETSAFKLHGTDCVRFRTVIEEQPRDEVLVLSGAGIVCRHPEAGDRAVHASYSERHPKTLAAKPTDAEVAVAEDVLRSITFTPLK